MHRRKGGDLALVIGMALSSHNGELCAHNGERCFDSSVGVDSE